MLSQVNCQLMTTGPNIISSQKQKPVSRGDSVIRDGIHNSAIMNPTPTLNFETWFLDLQIKHANSFCSEVKIARNSE